VLLSAILIGVIAGALHLASFGLDPMRDKGLEGIDRFQTDRIARKIEEAEKVLDEMSDAIRRARDRQLDGRVDGFQDTVRQMFRQVEADPRDLSSARRYLGVYLQGARDATVQFADLYGRNRDPRGPHRLHRLSRRHGKQLRQAHAGDADRRPVQPRHRDRGPEGAAEPRKPAHRGVTKR
jgi:hypothetical protein